jgi:hypothetical protein
MVSSCAEIVPTISSIDLGLFCFDMIVTNYATQYRNVYAEKVVAQKGVEGTCVIVCYITRTPERKCTVCVLFS